VAADDKNDFARAPAFSHSSAIEVEERTADMTYEPYDALNKSSGLAGSRDPSLFESEICNWCEIAGFSLTRKGGNPQARPRGDEG
ncbi:hypothetical protein THAOC_22256, partial [Thalassiosira oceanica]